MQLESLAAFAVVLAVACAAPGPTVAALVARVLGRGTSGEPAFCAGLLISDVLWLTGAVLGLAVMAETVQPVFVAIRYAGAAYLLYLAWALWSAPPAAMAIARAVPGEARNRIQARNCGRGRSRGDQAGVRSERYSLRATASLCS